MRKVKFAMMILAASLLTACGSSKKEQSVNEETAAARTQETENLLANLKKIPSKGIMLGHHDDTVYGIGWEGEEGRSDVKSVCGDYPAVISFDLGELELGNAANLDKVPFDKIRKEIINQYQRGGMVSLSWHVRNPKTGGDCLGCIGYDGGEVHLAWWRESPKVCRLVGRSGRFPSFVEDGGRREDTRTFPSLARTQRQLVLVGRKTVYP